jgi:hypothetical protein
VTDIRDSYPDPAAALCLHCRSCSSPLLQASGWNKHGEADWEVRLWCPECWYEQTVVLDRAQAAYLSLAVEEGFACVLETFEGLDAMPVTEPGDRKRRGPR